MWDLSSVTSVKKFRYYVAPIDHCTCYTWFYPLIKKSDFYLCFLEFQKMIETQFLPRIKIFQSNGEGELIKTDFVHHLENYGVLHYLFCPGIPQ